MKSENEKDENMQRKETNKREGKKQEKKKNQPNDKILYTAMNIHDGNTTRLLWHENMKIKKEKQTEKNIFDKMIYFYRLCAR